MLRNRQQSLGEQVDRLKPTAQHPWQRRERLPPHDAQRQREGFERTARAEEEVGKRRVAIHGIFSVRAPWDRGIDVHVGGLVVHPSVEEASRKTHPRLDHDHAPTWAEDTRRLREERGRPREVVEDIEEDEAAQPRSAERERGGFDDGIGMTVRDRVGGDDVGMAVLEEPRSAPELDHGRDALTGSVKRVEPAVVDVPETRLARPDGAVGADPVVGRRPRPRRHASFSRRKASQHIRSMFRPLRSRFSIFVVPDARST